MESSECNKLLRNTIEATSDGIYISDCDGKSIISNHYFSEMFGIPDELVISNDHQEIIDRILDQVDNPIPFLNWITNLEQNGNVDIFPLKLLNGRRYECYSAPIDLEYTQTGRIWTFNDVTKLRRTEEAAMLYLDLMSHDIRNRLQGIIMSVDILNMLTNDPDSIGTIHDIENNVERCANLISKVKAAENINNAPIIPRSVTNVLETIIRSIESRYSDVVINSDVCDEQIIMNVDKHLETLILSLFENAIQHNPSTSKHIWIGFHEERDGFAITIGDNGPGIDSERKLDIFDSNRRYGGVGLHVARQIVTKYGGTIEVGDRVSGDHTQGAEFQLWIPAPMVRWD